VYALVYAIIEAHLNPRIAYWTFRLQDYRFRVMHRAKQRVMHVDALSRIECKFYVNRKRTRIQVVIRALGSKLWPKNMNFRITKSLS